MNNVYLDYNKIACKIDDLSQEISQNSFDGIVVILRGGSFIGFHLSFLTDLPCYFLCYDRATRNVSWVGEKPNGSRLVLCEDFAGMGHTLIDCQNFLLSSYDISTFVICKDTKSASIPDYYCFDGKNPMYRFLLPWERYRINANAVHNINENDQNDHFFEQTLDEKELKNVPFFSSKEERAKWKGIQALEKGYTHLNVYDAEEAIFISSSFPELRVKWIHEGKERTVYSS
jgi:hypoxanthine phosphoribosyltransferase